MRFVNWFLGIFRRKPCDLAVKFKESREFLDIDHDTASKMLGIPKDEIVRFEEGY